MELRRVLPALLVVTGVSACAHKPPTPVAEAPPPPAPSAPATVDGVYRGTSTRYQADARTCPGPGLLTLRVQDGAFEYRWSSRVALQVRIAADSSLSVSGGGPPGDISMSGRASPGLIEGDVSNPACAFHFTARKRG